MSSKNIHNKIIRKINKFLIKFSKNPRPASFPYISGDGFRSIADHIYDETGKFNPKDVTASQIIFVKSDMLKEYFENIHPEIKNSYKLISHNSDENIDKKYVKYIDDKIIHWFAQNLIIEHPKITVIPIGLENLHFYNHGIPKVFNKLCKQKTNLKNKVLFGFNVNTNKKERILALRELRKCNIADEIKKHLDNISYLKLLNKYKFVASPPGNGVDCIRTWEALSLNKIPILKDNELTTNFERQHGLFLPKSKNWTDIKDKVNFQYNIPKEISTFNYWKHLIEKTNDKYN